MGHSNSFIKNSILNFNRNILTIVIGLAAAIIIARVLGPEKQGIYTLIVLLPSMLVTLLNLGIGSASVYFVGKKRYSINIILSTNVVLAVIISVVAIIIGLISIFFLENTFFEGVPRYLLIIVLSLLPLLFINAFLQTVFQGLQDFKVYNLVLISGSTMNLVCLVLTIMVLNLSIFGAFIAFFISVITPTIVLFVHLKKQKYRINIKNFSGNFIKDALVYGFKAHLSNILAFINYRADILLISYFLSPVAVGIYNVAVSIAEKLWVVSQPVSAVLFPRISSFNTEEEKNYITARVTRNVLFISVIFGIIVYLISDLFVKYIFGIKYYAASKVIKILIVGITLFSAERILSNDLAGRGKPELNLYTSLFTVIVNIALNIFFIPRIGLYGAALATSISYTLTFLLKIFIYLSVTRTNFISLILINKADFKLYKQIIMRLLRGMRR